MLDVELDIFSGMPNPRWVMQPSEASALIEQILDGTAPIVPVDVVESRLGYRGFIVEASGADAALLDQHGYPTVFRVRRGLDPNLATTAKRSSAIPRT